MAVNDYSVQIERLVQIQLARHMRYRCLILQSNDMTVLSTIGKLLQGGLSGFCEKTEYLNAKMFIDEVGAWSCDKVLTEITNKAGDLPVVVEGPLHFLDYWSASLQTSFWDCLASYTSGLGIIIIDIQRTEGIEGPFMIMSTLPEVQVRCLRSRLAFTEVRSV